MIDAYDMLGLSPEVDADEMKKAWRKLCLQYHPDKLQAKGEATSQATEKWNEMKTAYDILQDEERRKIYDTFGIDFGEERPDMEVWNIGVSNLLSPLGSFAFKTFIARVILWLIGVWFIRIPLVFCGISVGVLWALDVKIRGVAVRSAEYAPLLVYFGILVALVLVNWVWYLLSESMVVFYLFYLCFEFVTVQSWKFGAGFGLGSVLLAWLFEGRWHWVLGLLVALMVIVVISLTIASGMMRLWIDSVQVQKGDELKEWRKAMRRERSKLLDEVATLQNKLLAAEEKARSTPGPRPAVTPGFLIQAGAKAGK